MKNTFLLLSCCLFLIACDSCKNPDDTAMVCIGLNKPMPEATTSGKNTFGCRINGETWVAYTDSFDALLGGDKELDVRYRYYDNLGNAQIQASKKIAELECDTFNQFFTLHIINAKEGVTQFTYNSSLIDWELGISYKLDTLSFNEVNITKIDTVESILSGTFKFQLISTDFQDTLQVTEGRFDAPYTFL
jgi:hypothetical protein